MLDLDIALILTKMLKKFNTCLRLFVKLLYIRLTGKRIGKYRRSFYEEMITLLYGTEIRGSTKNRISQIQADEMEWMDIELGGKRILIGCYQIGFHDKFCIMCHSIRQVWKDLVRGSLTLETGTGEALSNPRQKKKRKKL